MYSESNEHDLNINDVRTATIMTLISNDNDLHKKWYQNNYDWSEKRNNKDTSTAIDNGDYSWIAWMNDI